MREWLPPSSSIGRRLGARFAEAATAIRSPERLLGPAVPLSLTFHDHVALAIAAAASIVGLTGLGMGDPMPLTMTVGLVFLVGGSVWLRWAWAGGLLGIVAIPVAVATATPLLLFPVMSEWSTMAVVLFFALGIASAVQLGLAVSNEGRLRLGDALARLARIDGRIASLVFVSGLLAVGLGLQVLPAETVFGLLAALGVAVPGAFFLVDRAVAARDGDGSIGASGGVAVAALSPAIAWFSVFASTPNNLNLWPIVAWTVALVGARHLTVQPLVRSAQRATLQRDVVVAAMEAERSRLAADLHDDALQDLTLLVRRLEAAGDADGAAMARHVAERLRAICGDLRLPILDDLGAGPALDWLVERIGRLAGGEVRLERNDPIRPPPEVELAIFRVAQEALANAVRHGQPPVIVRYLTGAGTASLSIDDAGAGIDAGAADRAPEAGHFGLLNMRQRAEAIGAILDVRRWPRGGTHVGFDWRGG